MTVSDVNVRVAPHNVEAEEAVLGSVLIDPDALARVVPILRADDFYIVKNGWVWDVLVALHERRAPIDFLTACDELEARGQLAQVGGAAYISHLINVVPTAIHAEGYACIVENDSQRRKLLGAASDIAQLAYDKDSHADSDDLVTRADQIVLNTRSSRNGHSAQPLSETVRAYYDRIQYLYEHRGELLGIPTGLVDLDRLLGGLQRSDLAIVAARPGMGKTAMLLTVALNAAKRFHQRVLMFSLEMSSEQVTQRLVSQETGIDGQRLQQGQLRDDEWERFIRASSDLAGLPLWIDDAPAISTSAMRAKAARVRAEHGLDMIVVDYLQLMTVAGRHENRTQEVSALSRALKALARELNVPVVAASQLSRAVEQRHASSKRPMLSDLRDSGSIEADADKVLFIYRDEAYNPETERKGETEIIVAKHRNGPTGEVTLLFRNHLAQFVNAVKRQAAL